jgi:ABC-2 type transport system ATP-binding protein
MKANYVLETQHLKRYFGNVHAVEDISLHVRKGEIFGFLGPNGAGKTTTISMILGLTYPTSGQITIFGEPITPLHTHVLRRVGTMVGSPSAQMTAFSARQNLTCMAYLRPDLPHKRINETIARVGLHKDADRPVSHFSTGMKQRLGLALALVNQPELIILDEPTNGLDPAGMHEVRLLLRALAGEGITILLSSHLLHEMEMVCDRVAVVRKGKVLAEGVVSELLKAQEAVRIRATDLERTAAVLNQLQEAHTIRILADTVEIQGVSSEVALVYLVQHGIVPKEVYIIHPDLESFFLELTQQNEHQS